MILDATDMILGRMATVVAKKAMLGEKVDIVNCENAVVTGGRRQIIDAYKRKRAMGIPLKGPYYPRQADRIVRRTVRGMLPYKQYKGEEAFKRVMCYIGIPVALQGQKAETIEAANIKKVPNVKFVRISEIVKELGAK